MKHCIVVLLLCTCTPLFGQTLFGIKAGPAVTTGGELTDMLPATMNYTAGVVLSIPLVNRLHFQPELLYSTKGYRYTEPLGNGEDIRPVVTLHYLDLPLLVRIGLTESGTSYLTTGINIGWALDGSIEAPAPAALETTEFTELGFVLGGGISGRLWRRRFDIDLRFTTAITNSIEIYDYSPIPADGSSVVLSHNPTSLSQSLALTVAFFINGAE